MKRVLVTGAAGFLGSFLSKELLLRGYEVIGMDNFFRGNKDNLPEDENFVFYEIDLVNEPDRLNKIVKEENPDTVFHYAAINGTKYFYDIPFKVLDDNTRMTQNVLSSLDGASVEKIIYASSSEVYGHDPKIPTNEDEFIILNANTDRDSYASSKALGEFYTKMFAKKNNIDFLIFRPFNTYGPRMDNTEYGQVVPEFIRKIKNDKEFSIIGGGEQTRSFCYVDDHTRLVVSLAETAKNDIVNVGANEEITIKQLAEMLHVVMDREFDPFFEPPRDYDTKRRQPDVTKLLKYNPNYNFIETLEGLKKTVEWYDRKKDETN
jgi:nucleoside-diphosphate-sugar epimerase